MKSPILITLLFLSCFTISAQKDTFDSQHFTHDIGFFMGPYSLQSDYGQRDDIRSEIANAGISLSLIHYLTFYNRNARWNARYSFIDNIAIKTEINYMANTNLQHYGVYADKNINIRSMKGTVSVFNAGVSAEYYFKDLRTFSAHYSNFKWNPYINIGIMYSSFENTLTSGLGDWTQDVTLLPLKYQPASARAIGKGSTGSAVLGTGIRYKLTERMDLSTLARWQYFFNDNIDGLKADIPENKYNEWAVSFQVGVIWHLNFSDPFRLF